MYLKGKILLSIFVFCLAQNLAFSQTLYDFSDDQHLKNIESLHIGDPIFDALGLFRKYKDKGSTTTVYHDVDKWRGWMNELFDQCQQKIEWEIEGNTNINTYKTVSEDSGKFKKISVYVNANGGSELISQGRGEIFGTVHLYLINQGSMNQSHRFKDEIIYVNTENIDIYDGDIDEFANEVLKKLETLLKEFTIEYLKIQNEKD